MHLFKCEKCGHVENTAMAPWHGQGIWECTLCKTGEWHGEFKRRLPEDDNECIKFCVNCGKRLWVNDNDAGSVKEMHGVCNDKCLNEYLIYDVLQG